MVSEGNLDCVLIGGYDYSFGIDDFSLDCFYSNGYYYLFGSGFLVNFDVY